MNTNKEMNNLKIGDRVRVVFVPSLFKSRDYEIKIGTKGIVKHLRKTDVGVEFDEYINGHDGWWGGKYGYCWYIPYERLEKIEETDTAEETKEEVEEMEKDVNTEGKSETIKQKVLEVLRKEIGVEPDEKFDVYQNGVKQWTCKFKGGEFCQKVNYELCKSDVWIDLIWNFSSYTFKRKPFIPEQGEDYFFLTVSRDENISLKRGRKTWTDDGVDYGMLALGNVFRSEKEAFASKDKLLEKLEKLRKGEV